MNPVKLIALLKKRDDLDHAAFVDHYENEHAPFIAGTFPFFSGYSRSFVLPDGLVKVDHVDTTQSGPSFDVVTALRFASQEQAEAMMRKAMTTDAGALLVAEEATLLDRRHMVTFPVEERSTPLARLAPQPAGHGEEPDIKMMCFIPKRPEMSREDFVDYYENNHSVLAERLLRRDGAFLFARYVRNYPVPGATFNPGEADAPPVPMDYDVITEISFWTQADYQAFMDLCAVPEIGGAFAEDEARLFDREAILMVLTDERMTAPAVTPADAAAHA